MRGHRIDRDHQIQGADGSRRFDNVIGSDWNAEYARSIVERIGALKHVPVRVEREKWRQLAKENRSLLVPLTGSPDETNGRAARTEQRHRVNAEVGNRRGQRLDGRAEHGVEPCLRIGPVPVGPQARTQMLDSEALQSADGTVEPMILEMKPLTDAELGRAVREPRRGELWRRAGHQ